MAVIVQPGPPFRQGDLVAVEGRRGKIVVLADDEPLLLIRWEGGRICDWVRAEEAVHADGEGAPDSSQGES